MTAPLSCPLVEQRELVERYIADTLANEDERAEFEAHVITCPHCQDEIRLAMTIRAELARPVTARRRKWRIWTWGLGAGLAAAVTALILFPARADNGVRALGAVRPPLYLGVPIRGSTSTADALFGDAMAAYTDGNYGAAAAGLERALAAGADSAPTLFFLGASRLTIRQPDLAAAAFRHVLSLGDSPYHPEAHYYLAKALLVEGDGQGALQELAAVDATSAIAATASALADSVRRRARR